MNIRNENARRLASEGVINNIRLGGRGNPSSEKTAEQDRLDAERERRIDGLRLQLLAAVGADARRAAWNALCDEISSRSPAAIERLECARGLRL